MIFKKDLTALKKNISTIGKKVDNLLTAFEKEQTKAPKPSKSKAVKAKLDRKAPVKKKTTKETATDQVLKIINRSKKGVNIDTLKKKTGFADKKLRNIIFRAYKEGKIQRADRGLYKGVE